MTEESGMQWLVNLGRGVGRSARWTVEEVALVRDSAKKAAATTRKLTGRMTQRIWATHLPADPGRENPDQRRGT